MIVSSGSTEPSTLYSYDMTLPRSADPCGLLQELLGGEVVMPSPEQFEQDVEDFLHNCSDGDYAPTLPEFDPYAFNAIDWTAAFAPTIQPLVSPPSTVVSDDCSWAPLSPVSDTTLVSDYSSSFPKGDHNDHEDNTAPSLASAPPSVRSPDPFAFAAEGDLVHMSAEYLLCLSESAPLDYYGSCHESCFPSLVDSPAGGQGPTLEATSGSFAAPFHDSEALLAQSATAIKRSPSVESSESEADSEYVEKKPTKRQRRPETAQYHCTYKGCTALFSRSHNLKVHVDSVHEKKRAFVCQSCAQAFARNHDLVRHFQSKHTNLGSPRNKSAAKQTQKKKRE